MSATSPETVVRSFWAAMQRNDWRGAGAWLADDFVLDWPQSGERIRGRYRFAEVNRRYPAAGPWRFTLESLLANGDEVVTRVRVTDGVVVGLAITYLTVKSGRIARQTEYWPDPFAPAPWRADLVELVDDDAVPSQAPADPAHPARAASDTG